MLLWYFYAIVVIVLMKSMVGFNSPKVEFLNQLHFYPEQIFIFFSTDYKEIVALQRLTVL